MKIAVIGCGALGISLVSCFAEDNFFYSDFPEYLNLTINKKILLNNIDITKNIKFIQLNEINNFDIIIWTLKAYQYEKIVDFVHQNNPNSLHIIFSNGFNIENFFIKNNCQFFRIVTTIGAYKDENNNIFMQNGIIFTERSKVKLVKKLFNNSNEIKVKNSMKVLVWEKGIINCIINPLTAIFSCRNDYLADNSFIPLIYNLFAELKNFAEILDINIRASLYKDIMAFLKKSKNYSSMYQDIKNKRKTEIEFLNGAILKLSKEYNKILPINYLVYQNLKILENKYLGEKNEI